MSMKALLAAAAVSLAVLAIQAYAEDAPCENMLENLRTQLKDAKLSEADAAKVKTLEDKGIERCTADDDAHADAYFAEALKILVK
jgi:hypothetical protein